MVPAPVAFPNRSLRHLSVHLQSETCSQSKVTRPESTKAHGVACTSFRDGPKDQTRNLEIPGWCYARPGMTSQSESMLGDRTVRAIEQNRFRERKLQHDLACVVG